MPIPRRAFVTGARSTPGGLVEALLRERGIEVFTGDQAGPGKVDLELPAPEEASFCGALRDAVRGLEVGLLVPTVRAEVPFVAEARLSLRAQSCLAFVPSPRCAWVANDLLHTYEALRDVGLEVPRFACGISRRHVPGLLPFPVLSRSRLGDALGDVVTYDRLEDLPERLPVGRVFHEALSGDVYDVVLFGEEAAAPSALVVLSRGPGGDGARDRPRTSAPDVAGTAAAACRALELLGPALVRVRRDRHGRPRVTDVEARPPAALAAAPEVIEALLARWR